MYNNLNQYKQQSLNTMTSDELLIVVYDELIKRLKRAKVAQENDKHQIFIESLERSKEIINYLINTLDTKYEVSTNLYRMYSYFNQEIAYAISSYEVQKIDVILPLIEELRETWVQARSLAKLKKAK